MHKALGNNNNNYLHTHPQKQTERESKRTMSHKYYKNLCKRECSITIFTTTKEILFYVLIHIQNKNHITSISFFFSLSLNVMLFTISLIRSRTLSFPFRQSSVVPFF